MGRPSKYIPATVKKICKLLAQGNTREHSAIGAGISTTLLYEWENTYPEFLDAVQRAEAEAISSRVGILADSIKAAYDAKDYATAGRLSVEYLKRKDRKNWGDNVAIDVDAEVARTLSQLAAFGETAIPNEAEGGTALSPGEGTGPGGSAEAA